MKKTTIALLIAALALPVAACGEEEPPMTAAEFCTEHGGVNAATLESDGDALCNDGTEFEADGDDSSSSASKKTKKKVVKVAKKAVKKKR